MRNYRKKIQALTLTELLVVMSVMIILLAIAIPAAKKLSEALENSTGTRSVISAAMANARSIAVRRQQYAGVRFQQDNTGQFYLVLIIDNKDTSLVNDFCAVEGKRPIKLPQNVGVMDCKWVLRTFNTSTGELTDAIDNSLTDLLLDNTAGNLQDGKNKYFWDACTFSIVFSPSGRLASKTLRICNQDGVTDTATNKNTGSMDKVFNKKDVVDGKRVSYIDPSTGTVKERDAVAGEVVNPPLFYQDDYGGVAVLGDGKNYGIAPETSRNSFILFDKSELAKKPSNQRWSGYLSKLDVEFVNPYTGELVKK